MSKEESAKYFALGNEAFVDEDYDTAIKCYSEAIKTDKENFDYYLKRSNAYLKKDKFQEALDDANMSIKYKNSNGKAWQRKGLALFSMEKYEEALKAYKEALKLDADNEQLKKSIGICEAEIDLKNQQCDSTNIKVGLSSIQTQETVKDAVKKESKLETDMQAAQAQPQAPRIKHDWYQTETHVIITVMVKNTKQDNVAIEFLEKALSVTAKLPNGNEYSLELDLAHEINPAQSSYKLLSTKIEMKMKKVEGVRWSSLETDNESHHTKPTTVLSTEPASTASSDVHQYPSSKHMYSDWDKLAKQLQEEEKTENLQGDAALNHLFQQIYSDGTDEVKRAMNKSFQESGGTVLSTNWKDIKKEKVEVKPPDCMEYKKYEY